MAADDYGWLRRILKDYGDRIFKLEHPKLKPVRQTMIWSLFGEVTEISPISGTYPVFDTGTIFELWVSVQTTSSDALTVTFYRQGEESPGLSTIGSITLPAGQYVHRVTSSIGVSAGDRISIQVNPGSPGTPAAEVTAAARVT